MLGLTKEYFDKSLKGLETRLTASMEKKEGNLARTTRNRFYELGKQLGLSLGFGYPLDKIGVLLL